MSVAVRKLKVPLEEEFRARPFRPPTRKQIEGIWLKGTAAFDLACRFPWIADDLEALAKRFLSARYACRVLGISRHTLEEWRRAGLLAYHARSKRFPVDQLHLFVKALAEYESGPVRLPTREHRFGRRRFRFDVILFATFTWPRTEKELTPTEIARRLRCHVSTIYRLIASDTVSAKQRTEHRYIITRSAWVRRYPGTVSTG